MKKSVIGIGNALVDILTKINDDNILKELNLPKGSMQLVDREMSDRIGESLESFESSMAPGGSSANTIHGLAKLGVPTGFICYTGNDKVGAFFEDAMMSVGVKPVVFHSDTPSGTSRAIVSADAERTFATYLGAAVELTDSHLNLEQFKGWDYCYIEGYLIANTSLFVKAVKLAKEAGCKVVLDLASYNVVESNRELLLQMLPEIDIVFANEEEAKSLTMKSPEESLELLSQYVDIAVVKIGKRGSLIKKGDEMVHIDCHKVSVVDTTGAGDMYAAGFLAGLINGMSLKECGELGSILAENIIQVIGAKMDESRWNNIKALYPQI